MKVYVYESNITGSLFEYLELKQITSFKFIGTEERNIVPEKKWVKKEVDSYFSQDCINPHYKKAYFEIPIDSKNIKLTFEVPE
jgi:CRISPR/Cas system CMR subunit Cmr6 (Cas7 group RAMP superfamily)